MKTFKALVVIACLLCAGCNDGIHAMKSPEDDCISGNTEGCRLAVINADDYDTQRKMMLDYRLKTGRELINDGVPNANK